MNLVILESLPVFEQQRERIDIGGSDPVHCVDISYVQRITMVIINWYTI
jgi:hypothetical protein